MKVVRPFIVLIVPTIIFSSAPAQEKNGNAAALPIIASAHNYAKAQYLATYFFGAQRCGNTQSWCHSACHTQDGKTVGRNLSGGWHDCGDYIKFSHIEPYAAVVCLAGFEYYPSAYPDDYSQALSAPPSNGIPDILDEVKVEADFLLKAVTKDTLFWQIGTSNDHNGFAEPVYQSANGPDADPRTVFSATKGYSNVCGDAAAALALMSIVYRPFNNAYADSCVAAAEKYYAIGSINPATSSTNPSSFYSFTDYQDEMGYGAILLYRATNKSNYLTDATNYASSFNTTDPTYYGNVSYLAFLELYKVTGTTSYLTQVGNEVNKEINAVAPCGYYHYDNSGSLEYAAEGAFLASLYHSITKNAAAYTYANNTVNFILGTHGTISADAPANFSFVIGYNELGGGYPHSPQHAAAFGKTTTAWADFTKEQNTPKSVPYKYLLKGALVGGPKAQCANYVDNINDYDANEVCCCYNAGLVGALAYINMISTSVIDNPAINNDIKVVENPVNETLRIEISKAGDFFIYDMLGNVTMSFHADQYTTIDVSRLSPGIYLLRNANQNGCKKIVKVN